MTVGGVRAAAVAAHGVGTDPNASATRAVMTAI